MGSVAAFPLRGARGETLNVGQRTRLENLATREKLAKNVLFWQLRTTVSAHEKESYLPRTSKRQRLSDMILPLKELSPTPLHYPLIQ